MLNSRFVFYNAFLLLQLSNHFVNEVQCLDDGFKLNSHSKCLMAYKLIPKRALSRYKDASGKVGSGVFWLNNQWLGSHASCKEINTAQYCILSFNTFVDMEGEVMTITPLQWGSCLPNVCTEKEIIQLFPYLIKNVSNLPLFPFPQENTNLKVYCNERHEPEYTTAVVLTIILCGTIIVLCLVATLFDIFEAKIVTGKIESTLPNVKSEKTPLLDENDTATEQAGHSISVWLYKILSCFSLTRNTNTILNTNTNQDDLSFLHGIRVLSLFWVILYHCILQIIKGQLPFDNPVDAVRNFVRQETSMALLNGYLAVDTFLVLSGLLLVYVTFNKMNKNSNNINWVQFYFHRFWRLTPVYLFTILFITKLRPFFGNGPWAYKIRDTSLCGKYWWTNLLYINNFHPHFLEESCLLQTWYLALDMQFFVLSPILIILYRRYGFKTFLTAGSILIFSSMIATAVISGSEDSYPVFPYPTRENLESYFNYIKNLYTKPYVKVPSYIVGMVLGCIIIRYKGKRVELKWYWLALIWLITVGLALTIIYVPYNAIKDDHHEWSKGEKAIFAGSRYFLWSICIAWVIIACNFNYTRLVKSILSQKFWLPLSRLNYAAFVLHYDILYVIVWNNESPIHINTYTFVSIYVTVLVLSYAAAFVVAVTVELPCSKLESLILRRK